MGTTTLWMGGERRKKRGLSILSAAGSLCQSWCLGLKGEEKREKQTDKLTISESQGGGRGFVRICVQC